MSIFLNTGIERQHKSQCDKKKKKNNSSLSLGFGDYPPNTVLVLEKNLGNESMLSEDKEGNIKKYYVGNKYIPDFFQHLHLSSQIFHFCSNVLLQGFLEILSSFPGFFLLLFNHLSILE